MPSTNATASGHRKKSSTAKSSSCLKRQKVAPPSYLFRKKTGEPVHASNTSYNSDALCIMVCPAEEGDIPDEALDYLEKVITDNVRRIYDLLTGTVPELGVMFVVKPDPEKKVRLEGLCKTLIEVPGSKPPFYLQCVKVGWRTIVNRVAAMIVSEGESQSDSDDASTAPPPPWISKAKSTALPPAAVKKSAVASPPVAAAMEISTMLDELDASTGRAAGNETSHSSPMDTQADASIAPAMESSTQSQAIPQAGQRRRRNRLRFRGVNFSQLVVTLNATPDVVTVLFKPVAKTDSLRKVPPKPLINELSALGTYVALRDLRDGGLAVDYNSGTDPSVLLAVKELSGVKVTASTPGVVDTCSAVLSGVHPECTTEDLLTDIQAFPPTKVVAVKRLARPGQISWSVKVTFDGRQLPERALLYGRSRRLLPYTPKPLMCLTCCRYGHVATSCRSTLRCSTCGEEHPTDGCPNVAKPRCPNCGGSHNALDKSCPERKLQEKVCSVRAASQVPHKVARVAVFKAAKTAKSYADAAKSSAGAKANVENVNAEATTASGANFKPNVAHHRPPPANADFSNQLAAIFKGLLAILTTAAASGDLINSIGLIADLFKAQVPSADSELFCY